MRAEDRSERRDRRDERAGVSGYGGTGLAWEPRTFYEDFPLPGKAWVSTLGPYNEHLVRDYGALNLALAVLLVAAAIYLEGRLVRVASASWLVFATPHFVLHLGQTQHVSLGSNVEQLGGLVQLVVIPLLLLLFAVPHVVRGEDAGRPEG